MRLLILCCLPFVLISAAPDFDLLQGNQSTEWKQLSHIDLEEISFYKGVFLKNYTEATESSENRIPKVVHFIWLGPRPFPEESVRNVRSWKERHPDWVFKFWTDRQERQCPIEEMEKHLVSELELSHIGPFLKRTENYGEKSDMLRYEILFQEGGVYVDHDVTCYRPFSALNAVYDFYAGLESPHPAEGQITQIFACNCVIGAIPGHTILQTAMDKIASRWDSAEMEFPESEISRVMHRTFLSFTQAVREHAADDGYKNMVLPAVTLFPDKVYPKKVRERLGLNSHVLASHKFTGLWQEGREPNHFIEFKKSQKDLVKGLKRRVSRLTYLCVASLLLTGVLIVLQFRKRQKI